VRAQFLFNLINDAIAPSNSLLNPLAVRSCSTPAARACCGAWPPARRPAPQRRAARQVDERAFEVGGEPRRHAGAVVFRNELLELIQYKPMSEKRHARPVLVVPPQINKFYIFDLSPNSFVQYMLKNGLQVFMVSWRNPDPPPRMGLSDRAGPGAQRLPQYQRQPRSQPDGRLCRRPDHGGAAGPPASRTNCASAQRHLPGQPARQPVRQPGRLFADEQTLEAAKRRSVSARRARRR
jgi:polyhydroxyalkanoate synthase